MFEAVESFNTVCNEILGANRNNAIRLAMEVYY
jgi:hypothetical protein